MKQFLISMIVLLILLSSCTKEVKNYDAIESSKNKSTTLNQFAVLSTLIEGNYLSDITYKQIKAKGDFGLGTFNCLHGEMVALDGKFYQATIDGKVTLVSDTLKAPFASVHNFISDSTFVINSLIKNVDDLKIFLSRYITDNKNIYSFKIHTSFDSLKFRSVPKQNEPFPNLSEVVKMQTVFSQNEISGTLVGYWFPEYLKEINAAGFHFHFISDDKNYAGHVLNCSFKNANAEIDILTNLNLVIPQNSEYQKH